MGIVYSGVDPTLDRTVAIKVIKRQAAQGTEGAEAEARFLREAKVAARINHPGIVTVYDAGREGDSLYIVMELVHGDSLGHEMASGRFPTVVESLRICAEVAEALSAAHANGVVHRDIKPANILLTANRRVKVTDFGVARAIGEGTTITKTGLVVGSPAYMAPEQLKAEAVDGRADLFSLGVVLYEMLLHRRPFPSDTITTLIYQILHNDPLSDPDVSSSLGVELSSFMRSCLAKSPAERVPDAASFARRANELARSGASLRSPAPTLVIAPAAVRPPTPPPPPQPPTAPLTPPAAVPYAIPQPAGLSTTTVSGGRKQGYSLVALLGLVAAAGLLYYMHRPPPGLPEPQGTTPVAGPAGQAEPAGQQGAPPANPQPGDSGPSEPAVQEPAPKPIFGGGASPSAQEPQPPREAPATPSEDAPGGRAVEPPAGGGEPVQQEPAEVQPQLPPFTETYYCSRGAKFQVSPEDAMIEINGARIGIADDWDDSGGGETYMFSKTGTYYCKFTLHGYYPAWIRIIVGPGAEDEVVEVETELQEIE